MQQFNHITMDPDIMGGKPCIRGMRVTVGMIVEALSAGRTVDELLADFPYLQDSDIREALAFAARLAQGHVSKQILVWLAALLLTEDRKLKKAPCRRSLFCRMVA